MPGPLCWCGDEGQPLLGCELEQSDEHGVGAVAVRPQLHAERVACEVNVATRYLPHDRSRVEFAQPLVSSKQTIHACACLGEVVT